MKATKPKWPNEGFGTRYLSLDGGTGDEVVIVAPTKAALKRVMEYLEQPFSSKLAVRVAVRRIEK